MNPTLPILPLYQSHKQVRAAEIHSVDVSTRRIRVSYPAQPGDPEDGFRLYEIMVAQSWLDKFEPKPGDYLVQYAGGYVSVSPAAAFIEGNTPIPEDDANEQWQEHAAAESKPSDPVPQTNAEAAANTKPSGMTYGG